jgi:exosome complex RNA-binding protein Rrp4
MCRIMAATSERLYPWHQGVVRRGHGTMVVGDQLVATVCGVVQRVNKLVTVRTVRSRYSAEVGDVVVGRVVEVRETLRGSATLAEV